ncbi:beta strand repeat-containing protein [Microvirga rosea]|uniref:beta strand repeat-containing protein n=1 Tax=Microvirga rosea TaxID=2715425 RepID=UPI001D09A8DB|nr:cadherin domain-containing protein [Microvirga rosea]MCB8823443.1 cadherin domain-containing protein [Microvirga rosea]
MPTLSSMSQYGARITSKCEALRTEGKGLFMSSEKKLNIAPPKSHYELDLVSPAIADGSLSTEAEALSHSLSASSVISGTTGGDSLTGSSSADEIHGYGSYDSNAPDWIRAGDGNDTIYGGTGYENLFGDAGNDEFRSGLGTGFQYGGEGDDIFHVTSFGATGGFDVIDGQGGSDTIIFELGDQIGTTQQSIGLKQVQNVELIRGSTAGNTDIRGDDAGSILDLRGTTLENIRHIVGGTGDDTIYLSGTDQTDPTSTTRNDTVLAGGGNDTVYGGYGDDSIVGGAGNDVLVGGIGNDTLDGGADFDVARLAGDASEWQLSQVVGKPFTWQFTRTDTLTGATETETLIGIEVAQFESGASVVLNQSPTAPVDSDASANEVSENATNGTYVGITASSSDPDSSIPVTYYLINSADGIFSIDPVTGAVYVADASRLNYEDRTAYTIVIGASDGSSSSRTTYQINVLDGSDIIHGTSGDDSINGSQFDDTILGGAGNDTLNGANGNDVFLVGGAGDGFDAINGGFGNDTIRATANNTVIGLASLGLIERIDADGFTGVTIKGSDDSNLLSFSGITLTAISLISAGRGNDSITGSTANDIISGDQGNDFLDGGLGDDTFLFSGDADGFDRISGGGGYNSIRATSDNTVIGLTDFTSIAEISSGGYTNVSISGSDAGDTLNFVSVTLNGITQIRGGAGNDAITGTAVADIISGDSGDDTLIGGGGDDIFRYTGQSDGFDSVVGGIGTDTIMAMVDNTAIGLKGVAVEEISSNGFANVSVQGSGGADVLNFSSTTLTGISHISGGDGNDTITGSAASDTLFGDAGVDSLSGGLGNDTIIGGSGDDWLYGDAGDDVFYSDAAEGYDYVTGGIGFDAIRATASNSAIGLRGLTGIEEISASGYSNVIIQGSSGADTLNFTGVTLSGISEIDGGAGNDAIIGSATNDTISGGAGDDSLNGDLGNDIFLVSGNADGYDIVQGGAGHDILKAVSDNTVIGLKGISTLEEISADGFANVMISGSSGKDNLDFSTVVLTGIAQIDGGAGNDTIIGAVSNDVVLGQSGTDSISGGGGSDTLVGGLDDDFLNGDAGDDVFLMSGSSDGFDFFNGGDGYDVIRATADNTVIGIRSLLGVEAIQANGYASVIISGGNTADTLNFSTITLDGIGQINGGAGNDTITGTSQADTISGDAGNDRLDGGAGDDVFLVAGSTNGFDNINGGSGYDVVKAAAANTVIGLTAVGAVEEISSGGFSNVSISGSTGNDSLDFSTVLVTGISEILGGTGNDTIFGSAGDDVISGGAGADVLTGGGGSDTVSYASSTAAVTVNLSLAAQTGGDAQGDTLSGFENVTGGNFADTITGDVGSNVLSGGGGADRLTGGAGNDFLFGGAGADAFVFRTGFGSDTIEDFSVSSGDVIELGGLSGITSFADLIGRMTETAGATVLSFDDGNSILLKGVLQASLSADDFRFTA